MFGKTWKVHFARPNLKLHWGDHGRAVGLSCRFAAITESGVTADELAVSIEAALGVAKEMDSVAKCEIGRVAVFGRNRN